MRCIPCVLYVSDTFVPYPPGILTVQQPCLIAVVTLTSGQGNDTGGTCANATCSTYFVAKHSYPYIDDVRAEILISAMQHHYFCNYYEHI